MGSSQLSQDTLNLQKFMAEYPHAQELNLEQARAKYQEFIDVISDHNHLYYIDAKPIISDVEYDQLFSYLKQIEEYFPQLISSNFLRDLRKLSIVFLCFLLKIAILLLILRHGRREA